MVQCEMRTGKKVLPEYEGKKILARYGIPVARETLVTTKEELLDWVSQIGFPVVLKGIGPGVAHKTEEKLIHIDIRNRDEMFAAFEALNFRLRGRDGSILVQEMVRGERELMVGMTRDPQFGPCVLFGFGGIFSEVLKDVVFRMAPITERDAHDMMDSIRASAILGSPRGLDPVNRDELACILVAMGHIGLENQHIAEVDINPLIVRGSMPIAVDALIVTTGDETPTPPRP